ncbi:MAG: hypothetical protein OWS74_00925, partial [Firmicutes bacterium]|nr:hypothetical protein [Bacillota bacterium]
WDRASVKTAWQSLGLLQEPLVRVVPDYYLVWAAAHDLHPAVIAIFGTGSVLYGNDGVQAMRAGGYGWQWGDIGSGMHLGQQALRAAMEQWDGIGRPTVLSDMVYEHLGLSTTKDALDWWYSSSFSPATVARWAPLVFDYVDTDRVAAQIVRQEARQVRRNLQRFSRRFSREPVGLSGGMAPLWLRYFGADEAVYEITMPAVIAAAKIAQYIAAGRSIIV